MKTWLARLACSLLLICAFVDLTMAQQQTQLAQAAEKAVNAAQVKPNEIVVIVGSNAQFDFLEALALATARAGGRPLISATSDTLQRRMLAEVPEQYLSESSPWMPMLQNIDVWLMAPQVQDPQAVFAGVPEARIAKASASTVEFFEATNKAKGRALFIGLPTRRDAELVQLDPKTYEAMQWSAINADSQQMATVGDRMKGLLTGAKTVRITSPAGTDFRFAVGTRPIFVNTGTTATAIQAGPSAGRTASLPGGEVVWAPIEDSGEGVIVVPRDTCRPYEPLTGSKYQFTKGRMVSFTAENPKCFQDLMAPYTGDKDKLASVTIGLNPALRVMENPGDYRPTNAAGMVSVGLGANQTLGGANKTESGWIIPIVNATVEVDGRQIVRNGQLVQ